MPNKKRTQAIRILERIYHLSENWEAYSDLNIYLRMEARKWKWVEFEIMGMWIPEEVVEHV